MRTVLFSAAVVAVLIWIGTSPANAAPPSMSGIGNTGIQLATGERVGYRRRYYRRYGYPVPYVSYPPPYGYYLPLPAYAYPPAIGHYPPPEIGYTDAPPPARRRLRRHSAPGRRLRRRSASRQLLIELHVMRVSGHCLLPGT